MTPAFTTPSLFPSYSYVCHKPDHDEDPQREDRPRHRAPGRDHQRHPPGACCAAVFDTLCSSVLSYESPQSTHRYAHLLSHPPTLCLCAHPPNPSPTYAHPPMHPQESGCRIDIENTRSGEQAMRTVRIRGSIEATQLAQQLITAKVRLWVGVYMCGRGEGCVCACMCVWIAAFPPLCTSCSSDHSALLQRHTHRSSRSRASKRHHNNKNTLPRVAGISASFLLFLLFVNRRCQDEGLKA